MFQIDILYYITEFQAVDVDVEVPDNTGETGEEGRDMMTGRRLVQKTGECNVISRNVPRRRLKFITDLFTTIIEMRWRWHIPLFLLPFVASWLAFAGIYLAMVYNHGDIENRNNTERVPCIHNVFDFPSAVLYSFETQTTIGYGSRVIDSQCRVGVFVAMLQIYIGTLINILVAGLVFAKISRPKSRSQTLVFSQNAVVCLRDGEYQLLFRVGDMRTRSHLIGTSVRALLVRDKRTYEGEIIPLCQFSLALETETGHNDSYIFLVWPVTVVHRIDSTSPLWDMEPDQLYEMKEHFEIIVILEGTVELTGAATQVLTYFSHLQQKFCQISRRLLSDVSPCPCPCRYKDSVRTKMQSLSWSLSLTMLSLSLSLSLLLKSLSLSWSLNKSP